MCWFFSAWESASPSKCQIYMVFYLPSSLFQNLLPRTSGCQYILLVLPPSCVLNLPIIVLKISKQWKFIETPPTAAQPAAAFSFSFVGNCFCPHNTFWLQFYLSFQFTICHSLSPLPQGILSLMVHFCPEYSSVLPEVFGIIFSLWHALQSC